MWCSCLNGDLDIKYLMIILYVGAVPVATLNLQRGVKPGWTIPDAWHHQMVYGVSSKGKSQFVISHYNLYSFQANNHDSSYSFPCHLTQLAQ